MFIILSSGQLLLISYEFNFSQYLSPGNGIKNFIVDRLDILYDMTTVISLGEPTNGKIKVEAFSNDSGSADLHNGTPHSTGRDWLLNRESGQFKQRIGFRNFWNGAAWKKARKRVNYFKLKFSSESTTIANWKKWLLRELGINLKIPIGQGGKLAKM